MASPPDHLLWLSCLFCPGVLCRTLPSHHGSEPSSSLFSISPWKYGSDLAHFAEDMIIASEAPLFVPSSYSSSFAKTILPLDGTIRGNLAGPSRSSRSARSVRFHRVKGRQKIDEDIRVHC